jgi:hypothetical protein
VNDQTALKESGICQVFVAVGKDGEAKYIVAIVEDAGGNPYTVIRAAPVYETQHAKLLIELRKEEPISLVKKVLGGQLVVHEEQKIVLFDGTSRMGGPTTRQELEWVRSALRLAFMEYQVEPAKSLAHLV